MKALKEEVAMIETTTLQQADRTYCVVPSESDEVTVFSTSDDVGRLVFNASFCCDDRSDLLPELIGILKSLRLSTVKAEMCTVGGRMRNVLIVAGDSENYSIESVQFLQSALKALVQKSSGGSGLDRSKRRRIVAGNHLRS